jgi:hypothetical protein
MGGNAVLTQTALQNDRRTAFPTAFPPTALGHMPSVGTGYYEIPVRPLGLTAGLSYCDGRPEGSVAASGCFAYNSLGFPVLLRFCDAHLVVPLSCPAPKLHTGTCLWRIDTVAVKR